MAVLCINGRLSLINGRADMKRCVADWGGADDHSVHDALLLRDLLHPHPLTHVL